MTETTTHKENLGDEKTSPYVRGKRLESLRRMMRLSRRQFFEKYGTPASSLQNWEEGRGYGLTEKAARKIIAALKADGITCTFEWLMYGFGSSPQLGEVFNSENILAQINSPNLFSNSKEREFIARELAAFYANYPNLAVDCIVADDGMEPRFIKGEHVAGHRYSQEQFDECIGLDCIVQLKNGEYLVRVIKHVNSDGSVTLSCLNSMTTVEKPTLYNTQLSCAAPVLWARRKSSISE